MKSCGSRGKEHGSTVGARLLQGEKLANLKFRRTKAVQKHGAK